MPRVKLPVAEKIPPQSGKSATGVENKGTDDLKLGFTWVSLGVRTCELFLCFVTIVRVRAIVLTSLFSLFYATGECHRILHRG